MDALHTPAAASKDQIEAAYDQALTDIRAALHKLAETLEQNHYRYDMDGPMEYARAMLDDFQPYVRACRIAEEESDRLASEERRDLWRNTNQWGL